MNQRNDSFELNDRLINEKSFHNLRFSETNQRPKLYTLGLKNWYEDYKNYVFTTTYGTLIEIGAGLESCFVEYKELNGLIETKKLNVISIDISDIAIEQCKKFQKEGLLFLTEDAHQLNKITDKKINFLIGRGIIHHLDIKKFLSNIQSKVIYKDCQYIFAEPLQSNFLIRLYRLLTPNQRTKDEKPLTNQDIKYIQKSFGGKSKLKYYGFITIPFSIFGISNNIIETIDNVLLNKLGLGRLLAWSVIITNINENNNL